MYSAIRYIQRLSVGCLILAGISCQKLVEVDPPRNTITSVQVFKTEAQTEGALAGIYSRMINGDVAGSVDENARNSFAAGLVTVLGGLSADEMRASNDASTTGWIPFESNTLTFETSRAADNIWKTAYTAIYGANAVIEGIAGSKSDQFSAQAKHALSGEAKMIRAFSYFYLVNLFGDVPLALTIDFNQTIHIPRTPEAKVYEQIIADLKDAIQQMPENYDYGLQERVRPNKWAAMALLARVYLFNGDYEQAAIAASTVISQQNLYGIELDLSKAFLRNSREAIWQLKQTNEQNELRNATPEGYLFQPVPAFTGAIPFRLTPSLQDAFEPGDKRWAFWVDSTDHSFSINLPPGIFYYPAKYKVGRSNGAPGASSPEYYMMLRLAEMYLVRAEAVVRGPAQDISEAVRNLNTLRFRAGIPDLPLTLTKEEVLAAIEKERQTELFAEWGHRWLDLKRTGRAQIVLPALPYKQPWMGNYQLKYPIPESEIRFNSALVQNDEY
ncbi:RagB/SusD family nutrient uptake outer membrane protein [Pseudoflavitalea rhizosphaerae]|uniref:RagB/SusD family nutrient uptake outer membrane protein n=1 Tax=Pseudoflavitalea rhizosphaerae TaxID=1884793 RepID=UPI000F8E231F|nr:RagB/SusD family nutrient uptake outer membrane protein [Pseudoflavitalea rhizosphaerae]